MVTKTLRFFSDPLRTKDAFGIPAEYHVYEIRAGHVSHLLGQCIADVRAWTDSPLPEQRAFLGRSESVAIQSAVGALKALPQIKSLTEDSDFD